MPKNQKRYRSYKLGKKHNIAVKIPHILFIDVHVQASPKALVFSLVLTRVFLAAILYFVGIIEHTITAIKQEQ